MSKLLERCHGIGSTRDIVRAERHRPVYNGHAVVTIGIDMRRCRLVLPFAIHDSRLGPVFTGRGVVLPLLTCTRRRTTQRPPPSMHREIACPWHAPMGKEGTSDTVRQRGRTQSRIERASASAPRREAQQ